MNARVDISLFAEYAPDSRETARHRASVAARRIAEALTRAADASFEMRAAGHLKVRAEREGTDRAKRLTDERLKIAQVAQLRECAALALEMQQAIGDALLGWVLCDDIAGTGLGKGELRVLLDVAGYNS